jgi:hypothetical protein
MDGVELASPAGIFVTRQGDVLFADIKPVTVRRRDGKTGAVTQLARVGAGPGEYRAAPQFVAYAGDSIAAYDSALRRWTLLNPRGDFARVLASGPDADSITMRASSVEVGAVVLNASLVANNAPLPAVLRTVVHAVSPSGPPIVIRQGTNGDLWAASALSSREWTVFDRAGRRRGAYQFASPFRLAYANDTVAVGQSLDADDVPQLVRQRLRPGVATAVASTATTGDVGTSDRLTAQSELTALLKRMVMLQETRYSDSSRYVDNVQSLKLDLPLDVAVRIVDAGPRGWFAIASNPKKAATCAIGVGLSLIVKNEAVPYCAARP